MPNRDIKKIKMKRKKEIIPAILPKDFAELRDKSDQLVGISNIVQVDICDGHFVPSFTWPYKKKDDNFSRILNEEEGLPNWQEMDYEFDLMVNEPQDVIDDWVSAGAKRIILHAEAKGDVKGALKSLIGKVETGIALNIDTPISALQDLVGDISKDDLFANGVIFVQLMGIDRIGFQGQEFDEKVLSKIKEVRSAFPDMIISIDGGVSLETAPSLFEAGADRLVAGSAIWHSDNIVEAIHNLKDTIRLL